jgi:hypothetical protein
MFISGRDGTGTVTDERVGDGRGEGTEFLAPRLTVLLLLLLLLLLGVAV